MSHQCPIPRFRTNFILLISLLSCLFFLIDIGPASSLALSAEVTLTWDANTDPGVAGYKLYYGTASRTYGPPTDVHNATEYTLTNIKEGTNYYFAVTAYDTSGNESAFSSELQCVTLVPAPVANGTISPSNAVVVSRGMNQTFTVTPAPNYAITNILVDGKPVGPSPTFTFLNVDGSHSISASIAPIACPIDASAGDGGVISPAGAVSVTYGASKAFTIIPNAGSVVSSVLVDGAPVTTIPAAGGSYAFTKVTEAHSIAASFKFKPLNITAKAYTGGTISPAGAALVDYGTDKTFAITPNTGYCISSVLVDGAAISGIPAAGGSSYTFTNVTKAHTVAASFKLQTQTVTASAGEGGTISPAGAVPVTYGTSKAFTIRPGSGYAVDSVQVDGASVTTIPAAGGSYVLTSVKADHTIAASFKFKPLTITAKAYTGGAISPAGASLVDYGTDKAFAITPKTGYCISRVLVDGAAISGIPAAGGSSYTFTNVTKAHAIAASFKLQTQTVTASAGEGGTISPAGAVPVTYGTSKAFTIRPGSGYAVDSVQVDGASVTTIPAAGGSYVLTSVKADHTITASFKFKPLTITAKAYTGGTISPAGASLVDYGTDKAFSITPKTGYCISSVLVDGTPIPEIPTTGETTYSFTNVTKAHTIAASFKLQTLTITATAGEGGSISPTGTVPVTYGTSKAFTIKPAIGYYISSVLADGITITSIASSGGIYSFTSINTAHIISATFASKSNTANATKNLETRKPSEEGASYLLAGSGFHPGNGGSIEVLTSQGDYAAPPVHIDWPEYIKLNGELRVATGNIDGSGLGNIVVGLGPAQSIAGIPGGYFAVLDHEFSIISVGQVNWPEYNAINGETRPACGDIDGDGIDEIVIGLGPAGEGRLELFKLVGNQLKHVKWLQTGWQDYNSANGETRPACGDLDGNGTDEVIVGLGPVQGNPDIPGGVFFIFDQTSTGSTDLGDANQSDATGWGMVSWPDYNRVNGEIWPACGDVNGDGKDEIVLGLGKEGDGRFEILGFDLQQNRTQHIAWRQSLLSTGAEVHPACGRLESDAGDEIVIGFSKAGMGVLEVFGNAVEDFRSLRHVQTQFQVSLKQENKIWPAVFRLNGH